MNSSKWWTMKYCKQIFRNCNSQRSHIHQQKVFISLFVPREAEQNHMCTYICKSKTFDLWLVYRKLWEHELFKSIINFVIWISMFFIWGKFYENQLFTSQLVQHVIIKIYKAPPPTPKSLLLQVAILLRTRMWNPSCNKDLSV